MSYALVALLTVPPAWPGVQPGRERRAAVAVRDFVPRFQQWGTREFSLPHFEDHYDRVHYFTFTDPTGEVQKLVNAVDESVQDYDAVDLFFLTHSNKYYQPLSTLGDQKLKKLRLVYNCGCGDADQGPLWQKLGAKAYVGHAGKDSQSPIFYVYFLRDWVAGTKLSEAVAYGNTNAGWIFDHTAADPDAIKLASEAKLFGDGELTIGGAP
jgi:hypothetical protein